MAIPLPSLRLASLLTLALLALGVGVRMRSAPSVLGPGGPQVIPTDSHYQLRFAQLQEGAFPSLVRLDPLVNFPEGAEILWPPLHTWTVGLAIRASPSAGVPEAGAVWLGPLLFLTWALGLGWLSRRILGQPASWWLIGVLALTPLTAADGALGNADHHVHEAPWVALVLLLTLHALSRPGRRSALVLAIAVASGRLLTTSGFLGAPLVAGAFLLDALLRTPLGGPAEDREARWRVAVMTGGVAAGLQFLAAAAWGDLRSLDYTQLGGFHPLWTLAWFAFAAGASLLGSGRLGRIRMALAWGLSVLLALPLLLPITEGLADAARADEVLSLASESRPLWGDPVGAISLLGVGWILWLLALLVAAWGTGDREASRRLRVAVGAGLPLLLLALLQVRLTRLGVGACAVALAVAMPVCWGLLRAHTSRAVRVAFALCIVFFALAPLARVSRPIPYEERHLRPSVAWLAEQAPASGEVPDWAVLSTWTYGHLITAWAGLPVLASPFSQAEVHERGNARALGILREPDDQRAFARAREAQIRYVLAAPYHGTVGPLALEDQTLIARLLEHAGMGPGQRGSGHFRLVHESPARRNREAGGPLARIFEVVEGGELVGRVTPLTPYVLRLDLATEAGASLLWEHALTTDAEGHFRARAPYPTERDPRAGVWATGPYRLMGPDGPIGFFRLRLEDVHAGAQQTLSAVAVSAP